jgi:tocopherol cyclase
MRRRQEAGKLLYRLNIFDRSGFQGAFRKKAYFEGWYFKNVATDLKSVFSFIPGISLNGEDPHAFIQIIDGLTNTTSYVRFDVDEFSCGAGEFLVTIGNNAFTKEYIILDIDNEAIKVRGKLEFEKLTPYPSSLRSPGIMGWFSYLPFMECNHAIVSANHQVKGTIRVNERDHVFSDGKGYIEKDWGRSFPESWLWLQCNNFNDESSSLFLSVGKIPWCGKFFIGFICFLLIDGKYHTFGTYNSSKISHIEFSAGTLKVILSGKNERLEITATQGEGGSLKAPVTGLMSRRIKESISSTASFVLFSNDGRPVVRDEGRMAGLEIIEDIFTYF